MNAISGNLSDRVNLAAAYLVIPPKCGMTRAFDNCFEMGDGDDVVRRLMLRAAKNVKLAEAIKRYGTWNQWQLFVNRKII